MSKKKKGSGLDPGSIISWAAGFAVRFIQNSYYNAIWFFSEADRANAALNRGLPRILPTTVPPEYLPYIKLGLAAIIVATLSLTGWYMYGLYAFAIFTGLQSLAGARH